VPDSSAADKSQVQDAACLVALGENLLEQLDLHDPAPVRGLGNGDRLRRGFAAGSRRNIIEPIVEQLIERAQAQDLTRSRIPGLRDFVRVVRDLDARLQPVRDAPAKRIAAAWRNVAELEAEALRATNIAAAPELPEDRRRECAKHAEESARLAAEGKANIERGIVSDYPPMPHTIAQAVARQLSPHDPNSLLPRFVAALADLCRSVEQARAAASLGDATRKAAFEGAEQGGRAGADVGARDAVRDEAKPIANAIADSTAELHNDVLVLKRTIDDGVLAAIPTNGKCEDLSPAGRAIGLLAEHPDWSVKQIAAAVGVDRRTLYKYAVFGKARAVMKSGYNAKDLFQRDRRQRRGKEMRPMADEGEDRD
jgi:hypothetical protein